MTTVPHASACARAAARSPVTTTPLPAARPSALTTYGGPSSASAASTCSLVSQVYASAVGIPAACMMNLANDLEPSMAAARRVGPKHAMPDACSASATPATSGASGPTTTRSAPVARARPATCPLSVRSTGCWWPSCARPGLPGATCRSVTSGSADSARASACSRPPVPRRRTRTARAYPRPHRACAGTGGRRGDAAGLDAARPRRLRSAGPGRADPAAVPAAAVLHRHLAEPAPGRGDPERARDHADRRRAPAGRSLAEPPGPAEPHRKPRTSGQETPGHGVRLARPGQRAGAAQDTRGQQRRHHHVDHAPAGVDLHRGPPGRAGRGPERPRGAGQRDRIAIPGGRVGPGPEGVSPEGPGAGLGAGGGRAPPLRRS